jgi:flagellar protein FliS
MSRPGDAYLETQVLTASPQRLRLMLIERAIGQAELTDLAWEEERDEDALEHLIHCREIITELIAGIRPDASPLAKRVLGIYLFLFQALCEAQFTHDRQKLADVRRILAAERQTWQEVCRRLPEPPAGTLAPAPVEVSAPPMATPPTNGVSLEA